MRYHESEEMYLETILILEGRKGYVRSVDIAAELGYSKPSVSIAMKRLKEKGHIHMEDSGEIQLTDAGRRLALSVYEKHHLITQLLIGIGAEPSVAEDNACRMEHVITPELLETIRNYVKGISLCG